MKVKWILNYTYTLSLSWLFVNMCYFGCHSRHSWLSGARAKQKQNQKKNVQFLCYMSKQKFYLLQNVAVIFIFPYFFRFQRLLLLVFAYQNAFRDKKFSCIMCMFVVVSYSAKCLAAEKPVEVFAEAEHFCLIFLLDMFCSLHIYLYIHCE